MQFPGRSGSRPRRRTGRTGRSAAAPRRPRRTTSSPATHARPASGASSVDRIRTRGGLARPVRTQHGHTPPAGTAGPPRRAQARRRTACAGPRPGSPCCSPIWASVSGSLSSVAVLSGVVLPLPGGLAARMIAEWMPSAELTGQGDVDAGEPGGGQPVPVLADRQRPGDAAGKAPRSARGPGSAGPRRRRRPPRDDPGPQHPVGLGNTAGVGRQVDHAVGDHDVHRAAGSGIASMVALQELDIGHARPGARCARARASISSVMSSP